jgi:hypothetical protein
MDLGILRVRTKYNPGRFREPGHALNDKISQAVIGLGGPLSVRVRTWLIRAAVRVATGE